MLKKRQLRSRLEQQSAREFCEGTLFSDDAFLFDAKKLGTKGSYEAFKKLVAKQVAARPSEIFIVGSSKLGYSLNPEAPEILGSFRKNPIDDLKQSDVDLVIIKEDLFFECWDALVTSYYGGFYSFDRHRKDIFRRFVSLRSDVDYPLKRLSSFVNTMGDLRRDIQLNFRIVYPVNYRIYRSYSDVLAYHEYGVEKLQKAIRDVE